AAPKRKTPAMVFACLDETRRLAAEAGEVKLALGALAGLEERFTDLPATVAVDTFGVLARAPLTAAQAVTVANLASDAARKALAREDYAGALAMARFAAAAAKKSEDPDLAMEARTLAAKIEEIAK